MAKKRHYLDIDNCILQSDIRKTDKTKRVKSKNELSKLLFNKEKISSRYRTIKSIYYKLYRYEKDGFLNEDKFLTSAICNLLGVSRGDLVKELL